jgi:hypothetical protein
VTARILVVDDEQDLEALMRQKFRRQIADGSFSLSFASDGVEALRCWTAIRASPTWSSATSTCHAWTVWRCWPGSRTEAST